MFENLAAKISELGGVRRGSAFPAAQQELAAKAAGGALPAALRWLWTTYGGGWTFTGYVHYRDPPSGKLLMVGDFLDADEVVDARDSFEAMPEHWLPIINDGGDNFHAVNLVDGSVNFHVEYGTPKVRDYRIADSLEAFILGLVAKEDE